MRSPARLSLLALLVTGAFVTASLERVLPNPFPMVRMGLANLWTLTAFVVLGVRAGILVTVGRVLLMSLFWGGVLSPGAALSAAGGLAGLAVMVPLVRFAPLVSLYGVSAAGAWAHVAGQLAAASWLFAGSPALMTLLGPLGFPALATGLFNAWAAGTLSKAVFRSGRTGPLADR